MPEYLVAGSRPWNRPLFDERLSALPGEWRFAGDRAELDAALAAAPGGGYRYVFFLHWSWKVPDSVLGAHECVNFHMTALPYGRGGSPLQNLIVRGHEHSTLTALRMTSELDAGPVYATRDLCLRGTAEEVFVRAGRLSADIVEEIVRDEPEPVPQVGEPVAFARRTPAESDVATAGLATLDAVHDFIRMLDADGYPRAFVEAGGYRFELSRSSRYHDRIVADVTITKVEEAEEPSP